MKKGTVLAHLLASRMLSLDQPWAWLVANGYKDKENRRWRSHFTGCVLIHATQKVKSYGLLADYIWKTHKIKVPSIDEIEFGAVVGWAIFGPQVSRSDHSKWFTGPYAWPISKAGAFPAPCAKVRGRQRLFKTPTDLILKIK